MKKKKTVFIVAVLMIAAAVGFKLSSTRFASDETLRRIDSGDIIGFKDQYDTYAWLGIPFAQAPVGELRWRAPQPVPEWPGVRKTLEHGSMCSQLFPFNFFDRSFIIGSEDCLYLDVWAPRLTAAESAGAKLPVMVWIHGGANTMGASSAIRNYRLAGKENVVVVALQYRLGLLGWFSHPALRTLAASPDDVTANFATLDMIAALKWVRNNIAAFGGDPNNVTIFGQSAGGFQVYSLVASPLAKGLFHRAIVESGNIQTVAQSLAENYTDEAEPGLPYSAKEFINGLLVADGRAASREQAKQQQEAMSAVELTDYLRGKSADELLRAVRGRGALGYFIAANIRDGYVLPRASLLEVFADPSQFNAVPMIIGNNRDEYKFWLWANPRFAEKYLGVLPEIKNADEYNRISGYFSGQWQAIAVTEPAAVLSRSLPGKIFAYRFDWSHQKPILGADLSTAFGAAHGIEVTFLFGPDAVTTLSFFAIAENKVEREQLGDAMRHYWASFARTGEPGNGGRTELPVWQPWQADGGKNLLLDSAEGGGIRMTADSVSVAELKQRLLEDMNIQSIRERCELYAQLFRYALTVEFWRDEEYSEMGCDKYPVEGFEGII